MTDETSSIEEIDESEISDCPYCEDLGYDLAEARAQRDELLERIGDVERGVWDMDDLLRLAGALR